MYARNCILILVVLLDAWLRYPIPVYGNRRMIESDAIKVTNVMVIPSSTPSGPSSGSRPLGSAGDRMQDIR